ncbi:MAG: NAD-dependent epimerase/dehydratase family protein [Firmicutes bacterium]|nr:NAD-dependent epimerase/dehydratase family protein [Bacillota bacterium]
MRVLVIGGTFFIGPGVVMRLEEMGHEVTVFHRGKTSADLPPGVKHLLGDRRDLEDFKGEFKRLSPDVVLDMFPFSEQDARTVMSAFKGIARRVVAISSQDVYRAFGLVQGIEFGPPDPVPLTENAPLRKTLYPYRALFQGGDRPYPNRSDDYEKILVEQAVMGDPDLPGTVLRLPMVYTARGTARIGSLKWDF